MIGKSMNTSKKGDVSRVRVAAFYLVLNKFIEKIQLGKNTIGSR